MLKKIDNKMGYTWLAFTIANFCLFVWGFVLLLNGVMYGQNANVYNLLGFKINSPSLGFVFIILGIGLIFYGITKTISCMDIKVKRIFSNVGLAYTYITPAIIGMTVLVFFPLVFGVWVAFTNYSGTVLLKDVTFPTLEMFKRVFTSSTSDFWDILFVNIWWTVINIVLSVGLGILLALILNQKKMKFKKIYRTLLVLPWAVPQYVTALTWKAMYNKEFGAFNQILAPIYNLFDNPDGLNWLSKSYISLEPLRDIPLIGAALVNVIGLKGYLISLPFMAVVLVNVWLGFPFMMIVALGGLQSISETFYEAAEIDGATKYQQFKYITAPLLKPTMIPAIILSIIWTFNQFNVIYLITTHDKMSLLVVSAYRAAFERFQFAYAGAYSVVVFVILASYSIFTMKMSKATEEVY
ncbi:MAG: carbohydrate ABC transporter permease [Fusobacteriota bacterium]